MLKTVFFLLATLLVLSGCSGDDPETFVDPATDAIIKNELVKFYSPERRVPKEILDYRTGECVAYGFYYTDYEYVSHTVTGIRHEKWDNGWTDTEYSVTHTFKETLHRDGTEQRTERTVEVVVGISDFHTFVKDPVWWVIGGKAVHNDWWDWDGNIIIE